MTIGVDVSKDYLHTSNSGSSARRIRNSESEIFSLLTGLEPGSTIAMEATGKYHKLLADIAYSNGFKVIVFNPKDVLYYARSVSPRAKTDKVDARVIASYALSRPDHHTYQPQDADVATLKDILGSRACLVRTRVALRNRLSQIPESESVLQKPIDELSASIESIDKELHLKAKNLPQYRLLDKIPGFGPVVTPYILAILSSRVFRSSDAFVAYLGLDLKIRESGKYKGKCRLTKRGDPEARRLLYLAALSTTRRDCPFRDLYLKYQARGMSAIAALNAVARKLARTAWAMYTKNEAYVPERVCAQAGPAKVISETGYAPAQNQPHHDRAVPSPHPGDPTYIGRRRAVA